MAASRSRTIGPRAYFWWFGLFLAVLLPSTMGFRDVSAMAARAPRLSQRFHLIASPFGTIEPATYTYARPIGTTMPQPPRYLLASFEAAAGDDAAASIDESGNPAAVAQIVYPTVNRRLKGNRLPDKAAPVRAEPEISPPPPPFETAPAMQSALPSAPAAAVETPVATGKPSIAAAAVGNRHSVGVLAEIPAAGDVAATDGASSSAPPAPADINSANRDAQIFLKSADFSSPGVFEQWAPGEAPIKVTDSAESGIKLSALEGEGDDSPGGETVAGKDDTSRLETPAQRLGLVGKARVRAEKCLSQAVYFEARGEPFRGQEAVAQVVMNRVFSGYYPRNVCGVVFQNADHYEACQFTFACEHKNLSRIEEPEMWEQAKHIAKNTLDGKIWLADIGHATHYHAYWVHPSWVHEMKRLDKLGAHTFYRPRAWGSGDDEPVWGTPSDTSKAGPTTDAAAKGPEAKAAPPPAAGTGEATAKL